MSNKTPTFKRVVCHGVLQDWHTSQTDHSFWGDYFSPLDIDGLLKGAQNGSWDRFVRQFLRFLPRDGLLLEAGCGPGHIVTALRRHGLECIGIDYSEECIRLAKEASPTLPVEVGDIYNLRFGNDSLAAYLSLGVMEHNPYGMGDALREAARVLRPGGVLVATMPYANGIRWLKRYLGAYSKGKPDGGLRFYQFLYSAGAVRHYIEAAGFQVIHRDSFGAGQGLNKEIPGMASLERVCRPLWQSIVGPFHVIGPLRRMVGHALVMVARKA